MKAKRKKSVMKELCKKYSCVAQYKPKKISKRSIREICGIPEHEVLDYDDRERGL